MNVEQETYKGHTIEIETDEDPQNPRTEWDNLTEIHCLSRNHYLGEHNHPNTEDFNLMLREAHRQNDYMIKVYAYIHSGVALSLESFYGKLPQGHAEFDSGCCGVIIVRRKLYFEEFGGKRWTKKRKLHAYDICKADIETFQAYLSGEVYGYMIDDPRGDSCWGYYSTEEAMTEAKSVIDYMVSKAKKNHLTQLKTWIKHHVPLDKRQSMKKTIAV